MVGDGNGPALRFDVIFDSAPHCTYNHAEAQWLPCCSAPDFRALSIMEARMLICMILSTITLMLTFIPLLASVGALRSAWKNNTNSTEPIPFFRWVKRSSGKTSHVAGDLSLTALALTVLVAVIRQWALTATIQLIRVANLWEASLGVCASNLVQIAF